MPDLYRPLAILLLVTALAPLTGCVGLFHPSIAADYQRTLHLYETGGPYERVIRACEKGRRDVAAFAQRCPEGSPCRQKEKPGDLQQLVDGYDYLEAASYYRLGRLQAAEAMAAKPAHEYDPSMRRLLGSIYIGRGEGEKAAREYFYLLRLGDKEGAAVMLPALEADLNRTPLSYRTPHLLNLRAARRQRINDTQGALGDYAASISAEPRQTHAYLQRARIFADGGMPEKALAELNTAVFIDSRKKAYSDAPMDELQIAEIYFERGRLRLAVSNADGAMADFAAAARRSKDPHEAARVNLEIGQIHESMDNLDQAITYYKKAADMPGFGDPWYRLAICYAQQSRPKESKEALVVLARIDREQSESLARSLKEMDLLE